MGVRGLFLKKRKFYTLNLMKEPKQPPVGLLEQAILYSIFILCLCLGIIGTSDENVQFMNFPSQLIFNDINHYYRAAILKKNPLWLLPFYMMWLLISIMKRCAERCSLQLYQTSSSMVVKLVDDDDCELLLWNGCLTKEIKPYFQLGPLSEILIIADLPHTASRIWTCAQSELCSSDNHYTTVPLMVPTIIFIIF